MKKFFYCIFFASTLCFTSSCSQEESTPASDTKIMVNLGTDMTFKSGNAGKERTTRAIDEDTYTDIRNYTVKLTKSETDEVIQSALYSDWELAYEVEPGVSYTLSASYGQTEPASYDNLLVSGSETFTVQAGSTKTISFQCKPKAAKVNVVYSENFSNFFSDCIVSIRTKHMDEAWQMAKADEGKDLYIQTDDTESVELSFDIKDLNGESVSPEGFTGTKTVSVTPQTLLKLTIKPDVTEIEGGKFGINVSVNTDVVDEDVNITIPNDIFAQE